MPRSYHGYMLHDCRSSVSTYDRPEKDEVL
jgi:hypothetical protein